MFKYIELFAGIGGFRTAFDSLGGKCVFASEIDSFAKRTYKALYDGANELEGDITKIDVKDIPNHDLMVGGFPCQAFSAAGQRKGFYDTRGTLFFEVTRIAEEKRPRIILLENVKGLLSHDKGRTIEVMLQALNDIGYAVDFSVLNSKYFKVPQNRERIYIVCNRDAEHEEWDISGNNVVAKTKRRIQALGIRTFNFNWPTNNTVSNQLIDVLEAEVDEKYYLPEEKTRGLVEQWERKNGTSILKVDKHRGCSLRTRSYCGQDQQLEVREEAISNTITSCTKDAMVLTPQGRIRKLTPRECWRLQAFTDEQFNKAKEEGISDSQLYKLAGNAVTIKVVREIGMNLLPYLEVSYRPKTSLRMRNSERRVKPVRERKVLKNKEVTEG